MRKFVSKLLKKIFSACQKFSAQSFKNDYTIEQLKNGNGQKLKFFRF